MEEKPYKLDYDKKKIYLFLYIKANSKNTKWGGLYNGRKVVYLKEKPVQGAANQALTSFIKLAFPLPLQDIKLQQGKTSKFKTIVLPMKENFLSIIENLFE